jgi:1,4-alpha-glucan branching enzyme
MSWLPLLGQAVSTTPAFPNGDQEITLIFDVKLAKDVRAKALLGKTSDVYLWSGADTTNTNKTFQVLPAGQTNFSLPFEKGKMTSLGNDLWSITLKPRDYYAVPTNRNIKRLGVLLKSGDGKAQTEDFFVTLYDTKLNVTFIQPQTTNLFVESGAILPILAVASQKATLTLTVNNSIIKQVIAKDSLSYSLPVGNQAGVTQTITITATTTTETSTTTFMVIVKPIPTIAVLPNGVQDGINYISDTKVTLVLYAPKKDFVYVIGDFNNWQITLPTLMKRTPDGNRYWIDIEGLTPKKEYAFQYSINGTLPVADPYSEKILDPNHDKYISNAIYPDLKKLPASVQSIASVLQTAQTPYVWKVPNFKRPSQDNLMIYELLIRDFDVDSSYQAVINRLPYLKALGINCIELMPIAEFTGNDSWGYNPTFHLAPDKAYGTREDLKKFVDVCHENGIAVILDVVYNQADYEFPYVKMYWDGTKPSIDSPFFNQQATHIHNVFFDFNHESLATKEYVQRANEFWLKNYKIDGYRFDLAKGFTQKKTSDDYTLSQYDQSRVDIWKNYYDKIRSYDKDAYVILELFSENKEEQTFSDMGMMVWGNQSYDGRNAVKGYNNDFTGLSYKSRGFKTPNVVGYLESHDEERMVYDALNNGRAKFDLATILERNKAAMALLLSVPGPKMIWQFGELGYDVPINENGRVGRKPIRWEYFTQPDRLKHYKVFAELMKLKTSQDIFKTTDFQLALNGLQKKTVLNNTTMKVVTIGNFDVEDKMVTDIFPSTGKWYDFFTNTVIEVTNLKAQYNFKAGQFHVFSTLPLPKPEANLVPWQLIPDNVVLAIEKENDEEINVFPNPTSDFISIDLPITTRENVLIKLIDVTGKTVIEQSIKPNSGSVPKMDLRKFSQGIYFIEAQQGEKRFTKKIVKE